MACGADGGGTACRLEEGELGGDSGADQLREPRLPVDLPPPARAQASNVHKHMASTITLTLVTATVRCILCFLLKGCSSCHVITLCGGAHAALPEPTFLYTSPKAVPHSVPVPRLTCFSLPLTFLMRRYPRLRAATSTTIGLVRSAREVRR
jgi:hypothetical protein